MRVFDGACGRNKTSHMPTGSHRGLDRIPLKDLKVGEEVDGRVKGRFRSMGWFLVREVSLEGQH